MLSQQQAEKEEQQRIKNLVLNYDLRDENEGSDGKILMDPFCNRVNIVNGEQRHRKAAPEPLLATKDGQSGQPKQSAAGQKAAA